MAMRRAAILFSGRHLSDSATAKGLEKDLSDMSWFLQSDGGGAWEREEIKILPSATKKKVQAELYRVSHEYDYCVMHYAGHGCHYKSPLNETCICLTDEDELLVSELNSKTGRQLIILDTCRKLTDVVLVENRQKSLRASASFGRDIQIYRESCRELYDQTLNEAEQGRCVAYACKSGQAAGDNDNGGYFIQSMIQAGMGYASQKKSNAVVASSVLDLAQCFAIAKDKVTGLNYPQEPVLEAGRRISHFPWAVR